MSGAFRRIPLALSCATTFVAACSKSDSAGSGAAVADSSAVVAPVTPAAAPPPPAMTDGNIVALLDQANHADSVTGAMAAARGMNPGLKAYGRAMMRDHHALRVGGQALATKANISPELPAGDATSARDAAVADSMAAMPRGAAFDRFYIDHAVMHHQQVLATAQAASGAAQNAELKAMIEKAAPIVQQHLDRAKQIQATLP